MVDGAWWVVVVVVCLAAFGCQLTEESSAECNFRPPDNEVQKICVGGHLLLINTLNATDVPNAFTNNKQIIRKCSNQSCATTT